jgi:hypothetical protein
VLIRFILQLPSFNLRFNYNWVLRHWIGNTFKPIGMAKPSRNRPQKAQTLFQVPNTRARERVFVQCLRIETEAVGVGKKFELDRATG